MRNTSSTTDVLKKSSKQVQNIIPIEKIISKQPQQIQIDKIKWINSLKNSDGTHNKKINDSIVIAKQYSYILNEELNFPYKFQFFDKLQDITHLFKNNNNLFETINGNHNIKPYFDLEIERPIEQGECTAT